MTTLEEKRLTLHQLATLARCSIRTLRRHMRAGELRARKDATPTGFVYTIAEAEAQRYLRDTQVTP